MERFNNVHIDISNVFWRYSVSFIRTVFCLGVVGLQLIVFLVMPSLASENAIIAEDNIHKGDGSNSSLNLGQKAFGNLTEEEKDGLLYMSDEEKLAGDVYYAFYSRWNLLTFSHIESEERNHEESLRTFLSRYGVGHPNKGLGEFSNSSHQSLYVTLVQKGNSTLNDALGVGAMIEELDISDLEKYMAQTEKGDLRGTYQTLLNGSENHLRIYASTLKKHGVEHSPTSINQTRYTEIMRSGAT